MPPTTRPRRPQARRTQTSTPTARFARTGRTSTRTGRTPTRPGLAAIPRRRQQPQKRTGLGGMLGGLAGSLPFGGAAAKSKATSGRGRGKKAGGLALLTAAAGFAVSNRDKLGALFNRSKPSDSSSMPAPTAGPTERTGP